MKVCNQKVTYDTFSIVAEMHPNRSYFFPCTPQVTPKLLEQRCDFALQNSKRPQLFHVSFAIPSLGSFRRGKKTPRTCCGGGSGGCLYGFKPRTSDSTSSPCSSPGGCIRCRCFLGGLGRHTYTGGHSGTLGAIIMRTQMAKPSYIAQL